MLLGYLQDVGGSLCLNRMVNIGTIGTPTPMGVINCELRLAASLAQGR